MSKESKPSKCILVLDASEQEALIHCLNYGQAATSVEEMKNGVAEERYEAIRQIRRRLNAPQPSEPSLVVALAHQESEFSKSLDGYVYYWPRPLCSGLAAHQLRELADELDRLNLEHDRLIRDSLTPERIQQIQNIIYRNGHHQNKKDKQ